MDYKGKVKKYKQMLMSLQIGIPGGERQYRRYRLCTLSH